MRYRYKGKFLSKNNEFFQAIENWDRPYLMEYGAKTLKKLPDRLNQRVFLKFMKIMCDRHYDQQVWNELCIETAPFIYQVLGEKVN